MNPWCWGCSKGRKIWETREKKVEKKLFHLLLEGWRERSTLMCLPQQNLQKRTRGWLKQVSSGSVCFSAIIPPHSHRKYRDLHRKEFILNLKVTLWPHHTWVWNPCAAFIMGSPSRHTALIFDIILLSTRCQLVLILLLGNYPQGRSSTGLWVGKVMCRS